MFKIDTNLLSNLNVKFQVDKNLNIIKYFILKHIPILNQTTTEPS
jgi:hypothetical protein